MECARRMGLFRPSASLAVNAKALEMKARGVPVISLAVGEPDFDTPAHIGRAAQEAVDAHFSRYTAVDGTKELRQAVCLYYEREYGIRPLPENIIVTNGAKQSLYNRLLAMLDPGDDVLIPAPYWLSYPELVLLAGGNPVPVPSSVERGFRIGPEDLDKARTSRTRALILNSPANPSGVAYNRGEMDALLAWAVEHDVFVVSDEVYDQFLYPPSLPAGAASFWEKFPDRIAIVNGLSKSFAMTGWRVGYTLAGRDLVRGLSVIQGHTTANVCSIAQKAGVAALTGSYACVTAMRDAFMKRRDMAFKEISGWPGVVCPRPEGSFYLFPDVGALFTPACPDAPGLCAMLLDRAQVAVLPGEPFGDPRCVRLSYAVSDDALREALEKMRTALFT
jgi:aspartate aminotransferase